MQRRRVEVKSCSVIRDALRKTNKVELGLAVIGGRERLVAVAPLEDGLVMEMLRYADELRDPAEDFDEVASAKPQKEMIDLAVQLIDKNPGHLMRRSSTITMARRSRSSSTRR